MRTSWGEFPSGGKCPHFLLIVFCYNFNDKNYSTTVKPMLRAVPSMIRMAVSTS